MAISTISSAGLAPSTTLTTPTIAQINSASSGTPTIFADSAGTQIGTLCRAWVNYKSTSTQSIRASFNVSSVTYNGTGDYTVNFTTAMPDANYAMHNGWGNGSTRDWNAVQTLGTFTTTSARFYSNNNAGVAVDVAVLCVAIFR